VEVLEKVGSQKWKKEEKKGLREWLSEMTTSASVGNVLPIGWGRSYVIKRIKRRDGLVIFKNKE